MRLTHFLKLVLPPILVEALKAARRVVAGPRDGLIYAPRDRQSDVSPDCGIGYDDPTFVARERSASEPYFRRLQGAPPVELVDSRDAADERKIAEHNEYVTFAYVLALAAQRKAMLKLLDFGGGLGHYYWIGKAVLPAVALEYHCREVPRVAEEGRRLNPGITWYADDSCFAQSYDLVMFLSSLQCLKDWHDTLGRAAKASREYLLLMGVPTVERVPGYTAIQRYKGAVLLHQQFNRDELFAAIRRSGFSPIMDFFAGLYPPVAGAPEQPKRGGWLFRRDGLAE